jgi:hypothetical protein
VVVRKNDVGCCKCATRLTTRTQARPSNSTLVEEVRIDETEQLMDDSCCLFRFRGVEVLSLVFDGWVLDTFSVFLDRHVGAVIGMICRIVMDGPIDPPIHNAS